MKIFKKNDHSLLIKTFGIKDTLYMACTVLSFFDLINPDEPLTEQELWKTVPYQLGQGGILDMGMPKPRGEVVVTGSCVAPKGTTRVASEVSVRVGELRKSLNIFGDRFWVREGGIMKLIKDPEPFAEIPITYEKAFGGEGFKKNPLGKGIDSVVASNGRTVIPLPNIEDPGRIIGSPSDRPDPAGFAPLDLMWPQRMKKQGTYDEKWQRERWPYFPDDMNYEFFNTAPEDQFVTGFFAAGESIEIVNMHPDHQVIKSNLPPLRIRCFVTKKKDLRSGDADNEIFQEVTTKIDTVWLFPKILRGVVMYRGSTEVQDDEFADVVRIFLASEKMHDAPRPIEHYLEEQKKVLDLTVPIDQAPLQKAQEKIGKALKRIKSIPKEIETAKLKAMGKAPQMPAPTPEEMKIKSAGMIGKNMALIAGMEQMARGMHAKYGHLTKIDLKKFNVLRTRLKKTEEQIGKGLDELENVRKGAEASKKKTSDRLKETFEPEQLKKKGVDPDNLFPEESINPWHDHGFPFIVRCRKNLESNREAQEALHGLGLKRRAIRSAWLGLNPDEEIQNPVDWGLEPGTDDQGQPKPFVLPRGLVMPRFDEATLNRVLVRPGDYSDAESDVLIDGSDETPFFLPAASLIDLPGLPVEENAPCVRVNDELQALYLEQEIGDICSVITLKSPDVKPDKKAAGAVEAASIFLIILPEGDIPKEEWDSWTKTYPNAKKLLLPIGNSLFETRRYGTDVRTWVMEVLPREFAKEHQVEPGLPEADKPPDKSAIVIPPIPRMDIKGMVKGLVQEIKAFHQPKIDALQAKQAVFENQARAAIKKAGKDPDVLLNATQSQGRRSFAEFGEEQAKKIALERENMRSVGHLTPEMETKMNEAAAQAKKMGHEAEKRYQDGMSKIEAGKKDAEQARAGGIPDSLKEKFDKAGIDPEKIRKLTREEVIERHERGESMEGSVLTGLDLSKLDLAGIDLSRAMCKKTNFSETNLDGANLSQTLAMEADFSKASLKNVRLERGLFSKAFFKEANLEGANLNQALMKEADLTKANLRGAKLYSVILQKAKLIKANLENIKAEMVVFSGADASDAKLTMSELNKCLFKDAVLDRTDFSGAAVNSTMFWGVKGEGVTFEGANLDKGRIGGNTSLPGVNLRNISMKHGCFRDSDLSGADFVGSVLDESILENCDLTNADLSGISLKKCRFNKSNLENANLAGANLFMGSLRKARIVNTNLSDSNLFAVDFYKATVGETNFEGANLKMSQLHKRTDLLD